MTTTRTSDAPCCFCLPSCTCPYQGSCLPFCHPAKYGQVELLVQAAANDTQPTRSSAFLPLGPGPSCAQAWDPIHGGTRSFNPNSTAPCCNHRDESLRANARLPPSSDRSAIPIDHPNTNRHLHLMNGKDMAARTSYFTSPVRPRGHWELNKGPPSPSIAPALLHASLNIARSTCCTCRRLANTKTTILMYQGTE